MESWKRGRKNKEYVRRAGIGGSGKEDKKDREEKDVRVYL